jgi:hypothetical protein
MTRAERFEQTLKKATDSQLATFFLGSRGKERKQVLAEIARRGKEIEE